MGKTFHIDILEYVKTHYVLEADTLGDARRKAESGLLQREDPKYVKLSGFDVEAVVEVNLVSLKTIMEEYDELPIMDKARVLESALDHMQVYNGRSREYCIALGMGYETDDGDLWYKTTGGD